MIGMIVSQRLSISGAWNANGNRSCFVRFVFHASAQQQCFAAVT